MSQRIKSADHRTQAVLDCIDRKDNAALVGALGQWLDEKGPSARRFDMFFAAACHKQGAGVVRILVDQGFTCSPSIVELAARRQCWSVLQALLPASDKLTTPFSSGFGPPDDASPFITTLLNAPLEVAMRVLAHQADPVAAAQVGLHALACSLPADREANQLVAWLVREGADPNAQAWNRQPVLGVALNAGRLRLALALLDQGADPFSLPHPAEQVMTGVYRARLHDPLHQKPSVISPQGWELLERVCGQGIPMPTVVRTPRPHITGFDRVSGSITPEDADRLEALAESAQLSAKTSPAQAVSKGPRL